MDITTMMPRMPVMPTRPVPVIMTTTTIGWPIALDGCHSGSGRRVAIAVRLASGRRRLPAPGHRGPRRRCPSRAGPRTCGRSDHAGTRRHRVIAACMVRRDRRHRVVVVGGSCRCTTNGTTRARDSSSCSPCPSYCCHHCYHGCCCCSNSQRVPDRPWSSTLTHCAWTAAAIPTACARVSGAASPT